MKVLTKADILKNARTAEEVEIEGIEGKLLLRPITDGEYQTAKQITMKAINAAADLDTVTKSIKEARAKAAKDTKKKQTSEKVDKKSPFEGMQINFDMGKFTEADFEAKAFVVSKSLSVNEVWSVDDVKCLSPPGIVEKIAEKVYEISGISEEMDDLVKSFRPD